MNAPQIFTAAARIQRAHGLTDTERATCAYLLRLALITMAA